MSGSEASGKVVDKHQVGAIEGPRNGGDTKKTNDRTMDNDGEEEDEDYEFKWLGKGKRRGGRTEFESVLLTLHETSFRVSRNDFVLLWGIHGDDAENERDLMDQSIDEIWQSAGCAKVEAMWEERNPNRNSGTRAMFQARWFFQLQDLHRIIGPDDLTGPVTLEVLKSRMQHREVVESLEVGDYVMNTIGGPARLFFRSCRDDADELPELPQDAFMCRWSLKKAERRGLDGESADADKEKTLMEVVQYTPGDNDEMDDDGGKGRKRRRGCVKDDDAVDVYSCEGSGSSDDDDESRTREGEGVVVNQGKIRVGPQHQVAVPRFDPTAKAVPRGPTLVWNAMSCPSKKQLDAYFERVAAILVPFAESHRLIVGTEPPTSLTLIQMKGIMKECKGCSPLSVSSMSTSAALLSSASSSALIRECDADALLENLHSSKYSVESAIARIAASPGDFLVQWTRMEREQFEDAFRRHGGCLRTVAKSVAPLFFEKTQSQIVDYHYRFKIPAQFRKYQQKKREQALRMMECIEVRRHQDSRELHIVTPSTTGSGNNPLSMPGDALMQKTKMCDWSETATGDITRVVEERRSEAKQLLLDIQYYMGKEKMAEVAGAIISLKQGSERESKEAVLRIFKDHPQLHQRLVEFLPGRLWT